MSNIKKLVSLVLLGFFVSCSSDSFTDPNDPKFDDISEESSEDAEDLMNNDLTANVDVTLSVDANDTVEINPEIFGVNNDWRQIPDNTFSNFATTISSIGNTLMRYPGGWESEFYAWSSNATPGWQNTPAQPGASVTTLKSNISNYSIVIATVDAMNTTLGTSEYNEAIDNLKSRTREAITISNIGNGIVEIGNEWWLQAAGGVSRADKLDKYVTIAMDLAEYIRTEFPSREFKLLINGDYTKPEEFTTMKNKFTRGYEEIDGVALHTYTGYQTDTHNIVDLESRIIESANNFNPNKNFKYLSEWMPSRLYNDSALYMEAANLIPDIIQIYARAASDAAAFWPPINVSIPGLGLTSTNYATVFPTGQILGELSKSYTGVALKTNSDIFHLAAALNDDNTMVVFITGGDESGKTVGVEIDGFIADSIENIERYVPTDYSDTAKAEPYITETATAEISSNGTLVLDVNKEGPYQIYKVVLKGNRG